MSASSDSTSQWVPAFLSDQLAPGEVVQTYINGRDVALWRSYLGTVNAWVNRCPHRGMRFSHGFVRGEMLACIYHGWHYGSDGVCAYIPAHPDLKPPETICVDRFECTEQSGLIWISTSAQPGPLPKIPGAHPLRSMIINSAIASVASALSAYGSDYLSNNPTPSENLGKTGLSFKMDDQSVVTVALQEISEQETFLHILTNRPLSAAEKVELSRHFDRLREMIETKEAA